MPIDPVSMAAASERMSPNTLPVTITSNCLGARMSIIAAASTNWCVNSTSGIFLADPRRDLPPQLHRLEHVGLVDRAHFAPALARGLESHAHDALDLAFRVAHRVEGFPLAGGVGCDAARLAEIQVPGQLAQDHDVQSLDDFALERRGFHQLGKQKRGPEVREQPQRFAQAAAGSRPGRIA